MNNIAPLTLIAPIAARTDNTPIVSEIIPTAGYESLTLLLILGTNTDTDATFAVLVEDGDDPALGDNVAVDDKYLIGTEALAGFTAAADDKKVKKIGYLGMKKYVRVTVTPTGNDSGNIFIAGVALRGHAREMPTANPPAAT